MPDDYLTKVGLGYEWLRRNNLKKFLSLCIVKKMPDTIGGLGSSFVDAEVIEELHLVGQGLVDEIKTGN